MAAAAAATVRRPCGFAAIGRASRRRRHDLINHGLCLQPATAASTVVAAVTAPSAAPVAAAGFNVMFNRWIVTSIPTAETTIIYLKACWSEDDLEEGDIVKAQLNWADIIAQADDLFGSHQNLEYYDGDDWKALVSLDDLKPLPFTKRPIPIRIPDLFQQDDDLLRGGDKDDDGPFQIRKVNAHDEMARMRKRAERDASLMLQKQTRVAIENLAQRLHESGHVRVSNDTLNDPQQNRTITTRDWVLAQVARDQRLRSLILSQPRCLQHIVQCLHWEMLWKEPRYDDNNNSNNTNV